MKIGVDCTVLSYPLGGVGHYLNNILNKLVEIDATNEYILFSNLEFEFKLQSNKWKKLIKPSIVHSLLGIRKPLFGNSPEKENLDLFWGAASAFPFNLPAYTKKILTIHDLCWIDFPDGISFKSRIYHRLFLEKFIYDSDLIFAVSNFTKSRLNASFPSVNGKVKVIYEGVASYFRSIDKSEALRHVSSKYGINTQYLLNVGTIGPRKNLENVFASFELIKQKNKSELKLVITGLKEYRTSVPKDVILLGYVNNEDLVYLYNAASLLIFLSWYEGFGLPPIESMACGTPCVVSNTSSIPEVVGDSAVQVPPDNPNMIADAVLFYMTSALQRDELRQKGFSRSKLFTWDNAAMEIMKSFNQLKNENTASS